MIRPNDRGFLLPELALALSGIALLVGFVRAAEPVVDRFCAVATSPAPNGGKPARMMSDVGRWVCASVPADEAPENEYARLRDPANARATP
jgi:hypothetical protein